ncbi:hypothetical protein QYE76_031089 [Lolium multiflorum]|uniref:Reverse transcriptase zinc-binding domain-containing protein n=1 Tax=Lolium multiflorum TaxID=4521 RepID=A0AAD8VJE0_LOLMU|nr:hypothetical protein QYE76_031089 [Lolium multiflorum]
MNIASNRKERELFSAATKITIGDGKTAAFWTDRWLKDQAPCSIAPDIFKISIRKNRTVADALHNNKWLQDLRFHLSIDHLPQLLGLAERLEEVTLTGTPDDITWRFDSKGSYSAGSAYKIQFIGATTTNCMKTVWSGWAPDRCKFFIWTLMLNKMDGGERAKKPILSEMTSHSVTSDIPDNKMDVGEGTKKRMLCEMTSKSVCSDIPDDKKHRVEENSILSDDKGEMACQSFKPPTPPCLLSMETDAAGPGTDEPIPGIIVPHEEGCGLGLPPAVETGGAAGAASVEPLVNGVVPREFSELEQNGLPIVKTDIAGADAGVATMILHPKEQLQWLYILALWAEWLMLRMEPAIASPEAANCGGQMQG